MTPINVGTCAELCKVFLVMGDRLNFIIDHLLESVDAFRCDFADYNRFTHIH